MDCPKCGQMGFNNKGECSNCQFVGDPALIEELAHITWLLNEVNSGDEGEGAFRDQLVERYLALKGDLEVELGLRPRPFSDEEASQTWSELFRFAIASASNWAQS